LASAGVLCYNFLHSIPSPGGPLAGDKKVYEKAMREGLNFAWEGKWEDALAAFEQALAEEPNDPAVHSHLGLAYFQLGRFEPASESYAKASQLAPEDPVPLARIAEVYEQLGQRDAAASALFSMADIYQRQRDWTQAIQALQRTVLLLPDHLPARMALAELYSQLDQPQRAITEYLNLARVLRQQGQVEKALEQCRKALEFDPRNPEARALTRALQRGEPGEEIVVPPSLAEEGASPADIARDKALEELANIPFEDTLVAPAAEPGPAEAEEVRVEAPIRPVLSRQQIDALVAKAIDFQTRGLTDDAIACYKKVIAAGVDRPAAHFNLGLLYQQRLRFEPAIVEFKKAAQNPQYVLGSHFALGECYKASGRIDDALEQFVQVLKIVDLGTVQRDQVDDLIQLYDALADSYIAKGDSEKALAFVNSLIDFLTSKGWQDKARQARERLDSMSEEGDTVSLAELLAAPSADTILATMSLSQEYIKRRAFTAAAELCYEAIEVAPGYLPLHLRLAEVFAQDDRFEDAIAKYEAVAELCLVREEPRQAIGVYKRILRLKPMDVVIRSRLIDLLISSGEIDEALGQYVALADAYFDLAQPDKTLEKYAEALRLAPRSSNEREWRIRLLRDIAESHVRRAHWREAVEIYHQIVTVAPDDERAHLNLIDLHFRLGRANDADKETVAMLEYYHSQGEDARALALLEEAVRMEPQQMPLRARLARAYIDAGMCEEAVRELDALGELQLDAGLRKQAIATVRLIISLNPKNVEAYHRLLAQL
jgi:tetratricopeptide (TPR) repeat protein